MGVARVVDERPMKIMEPAVNKLNSVSERLKDFFIFLLLSEIVHFDTSIYIPQIISRRRIT